jgi:hypothetical protein
VRGKATLFRELKKFELSQGGESDSTTHGAEGYVKFYIKDDNGAVIAYGASPKRECPAKAPGNARICAWQPGSVDIPENVVKRAAKLDVEPVCTDQPFRPFGANYDAIGKTGLFLVLPNEGKGPVRQSI